MECVPSPSPSSLRSLARRRDCEEPEAKGDGAFGVERGARQNSGGVPEFELVQAIGFEDGLVAQKREVFFLVLSHL